MDDDIRKAALQLHRAGSDTFTKSELVDVSGYSLMTVTNAVKRLKRLGIMSGDNWLKLVTLPTMPKVAPGTHHKAEDVVQTSKAKFPICYEIVQGESVLTSQVFKDLSNFKLSDVRNLEEHQWERLRMFFKEMSEY